MKTDAAMKRAGELMFVKIKDLPTPAYDYMKELSSKLGFCGEVCITAYAAYAQAVEGLKCEDKAYKITQEGKEWFKQRLGKL